jgi:hypothetical protein
LPPARPERVRHETEDAEGDERGKPEEEIEERGEIGGKGRCRTAARPCARRRSHDGQKRNHERNHGHNAPYGKCLEPRPHAASLPHEESGLQTAEERAGRSGRISGVTPLRIGFVMAMLAAVAAVVTTAFLLDGPSDQATAFAGRSEAPLRLLVADAPAPFLLDVGSGAIERVTGLPQRGERGVEVLQLGEDALVVSTRYCNRCESSTAYVLPRGETRATPIGRALGFLPGRDGNGVWTLRRKPGGGCAIVRVALDGGKRGPAYTAPCAAGMVADSAAGLVLTIVRSGGRDPHNALLTWDGRLMRLPYEGAQPVNDEVLLTGADRHSPLLLHVVGRTRPVRLRWPSLRNYSLDAVGGDPTGRLAIVDFAHFDPYRLDIWVLDLRSRRWKHLPDMPARVVPKVTDIRWTPDGRVVILSDDRLAVWRPGEPVLRFSRVPRAREAAVQFVLR